MSRSGISSPDEFLVCTCRSIRNHSSCVVDESVFALKYDHSLVISQTVDCLAASKLHLLSHIRLMPRHLM